MARKRIGTQTGTVTASRCHNDN